MLLLLLSLGGGLLLLLLNWETSDVFLLVFFFGVWNDDLIGE